MSVGQWLLCTASKAWEVVMSGVLSKKIECFSHTGVTFRFTPMAETDPSLSPVGAAG